MALLCAAALPIAFVMHRISINAPESNPIQPAPGSRASRHHDVRISERTSA
jgi:hypothetical protein